MDGPGLTIRSARVLFPPAGPDKDAELSGIISGTAFVERLDTMLSRVAPVDGVVTL